MTRFERLVNLYNQLGLCTDEGTINRGEIAAYCMGMRIVDEVSGITIDEGMISIPYCLNNETRARDFTPCIPSFAITNHTVLLDTDDYEHVGEVVHAWFNPFFDVMFNDSGVPWKRMKRESWSRIDKRNYRWSMIDTKGV